MAVRFHPDHLIHSAFAVTFSSKQKMEHWQRTKGVAMKLAIELFREQKPPRKCKNLRISNVDVLPVVYVKSDYGMVTPEWAGTPILSVEEIAGMKGDKIVHVGHDAYYPTTEELRFEIVITLEGQTTGGESFQKMFGFPGNFEEAMEQGEWHASLEIKRGTTLTPGPEHTLFNQVYHFDRVGAVFTSVRTIRGKTTKYRYRGYAVTGETTNEGEKARNQRLFRREVIWDGPEGIELHKPRYVKVTHTLDCHLVRQDLGEFTGYSVTSSENSSDEIAVEDDEVADEHTNVFNIFDVLAPFGISQASEATPSAIAAARETFSPDFNKSSDKLAMVMFAHYKRVYKGHSPMALKRKIQPKVRTALFKAAIEKVEANFLQEEPVKPPRGSRKKKADEQEPPPEGDDDSTEEGPASSEEPAQAAASADDDNTPSS